MTSGLPCSHKQINLINYWIGFDLTSGNLLEDKVPRIKFSLIFWKKKPVLLLASHLSHNKESLQGHIQRLLGHSNLEYVQSSNDACCENNEF